MFGQLFVFLAYRLAKASVVAPFLYLATAWAALSGTLVFADPPNLISLTGMAMIASAGLATISLDSRRRRALVTA
jgi:drug/metabolite transporter (DMT)-like permease